MYEVQDKDAPLFRLMDTNGDGTGTKNANGNYSTPDIFYIEPSSDRLFLINRMIVCIEDAAGMRAERYGSLSDALTNGIIVRVSDNSGVKQDLTDGIPVKTNAGWGTLCFDVDVKTWGAGDELLLVRWTFQRSGVPIPLNGAKGEKLEIYLQDDFTGIVNHYFFAQGRERFL